MCLSGVPVRLIVFEMKYLKIDRLLFKYYKAKSLDGSSGISLKLKYAPLTEEPRSVLPAIAVAAGSMSIPFAASLDRVHQECVGTIPLVK